MTTAADKSRPIVPPPPGAVGAQHRVAVWLWVAIALLSGLVVIGGVTAARARVPYRAIAPGSAYQTESLVSVQGAETHDAEGEVLFLTASLSGRSLTLLGATEGWVDPDVRVIPEDRLLGDRSDEEQQERAQLQMEASKDVAVIVALSRLGYELSPTATGALVVEVQPGTPAEAAVALDDAIVAVDGQPITLHEQLANAIRAHRPGDTVTLTVENAERVPREVTATLAEHPDEAGVAFLGVSTVSRDFDAGLPFEVTIDSGNVGGPSAGLAFTLAVIDVLTPGELTGGRTIAVTGTIGPDGSVGLVDGVAQKSVAAKAAGATVMLVPVGNEAEARAHDHGMTIRAVGTLDEALAALAELGGDPLA
jgi:PDZ domain-containing protein